MGTGRAISFIKSTHASIYWQGLFFVSCLETNKKINKRIKVFSFFSSNVFVSLFFSVDMSDVSLIILRCSN